LVQKAEGKDEILAQSDAVLWQRQYRKLERQMGQDLLQLLVEGTSVLLKVRVEFSERFGFKLIIEDIDLSYTIGQLEQQRRNTLERLKKEQLLSKNSSTTLQLVPQRLAVISSPTAAGLEEFCAQALHSGLAAVCVTIVDSADSQPTSTTSSTSSSSNPGGGGGESSSDNDDDEDDIFGEGSEQSASSPAQARVAAQVHALAILQALDAASTQTTPPSLSSSSTGNKGGSSGYNGGNSTTARTAVATILAGSDGWRRARGQRHDLMMVNASVTGYLTN
jgi:hypothetical protein